jgi:hypothetical protein
MLHGLLRERALLACSCSVSAESVGMTMCERCENVFFAPLSATPPPPPEYLPRQARDKHGKTLNKDPFSAGSLSLSLCLTRQP